MSYDISIGDHSHNYTYNLSALFYDHMPADGDNERGGIHILDGITGRSAGDKIARAIERIQRTSHEGEERMRIKYDPSNGWGTTTGAILFLSLVMASCYQNPRSKVHVS